MAIHEYKVENVSLKSLENLYLLSTKRSNAINTCIQEIQQYINNDKYKSVSLGVTELTDRHTSENIEMWLLNVADEWKICTNSIIAIVSDNGANIKKAIKDGFGANKHLSCFAHNLNLVPSKVLESDDISIICRKVKSIVTYFKKSVAAIDLLRAASDLKLIQSVDTRWSSSHGMLDRFIQLSDKIGSTLLSFLIAPIMVTARELQMLKEFIELLKPFKEATLIICGENYLTASTAIPITNTLRIKLYNSQPETHEGIKMKEQLIEQFELRFDQSAYSNVINKLAGILNQTNSNKDDCDLPNINVSTDSFWFYHENLLNEVNSRESSNSSEIPEDFRYYLSQPLIQMDSCPIQYWKANSNALHKLGRKYLADIATSVPCERLFSKTGRIMSESRNHLNSEHLQQLIFLGSLSLDDWTL
ncbi:E3 SUMO-protein ligase ZBED1-like [Prorops nasuta]|uniref:E3 SUMO-protein ligase ZBED1-like n=1 Tax=Prorops nasuta TaxID=863751 RepID=UPI0034CE98FF